MPGLRENVPTRTFAAGSIAFALASAFIQAWTTRYEMNEDGPSYLEIAALYLHHAGSAAVNTYWNPLYSVFLAPALALTHRPGLEDFAAAHFANLAIFTLALAAFSFFLWELRATQTPAGSSPAFAQPAAWVWCLLGCALFLSCALDLITTTLVSPDLLIATLVFAVMGILLRGWRVPERHRWLPFGWLGVLLGLGYLAKPVMLVFGLVVSITLLVATRVHKQSFRPPVLALLLFSLVAGPYILLISSRAHRFTISENGPLTYLFVVDGQPYGYSHGRPLPAGSHLLHPAQRVFDSPAAYAFATPVPGSCPIWFNTSYWYEGVKIPFAPFQQALLLVKNLRTISRIVFVRQAGLCVSLLALLLLFSSAKQLWQTLRQYWIVLIPASALLGLYFLFNLESRLIAPYLTVLWACAFASVRPTATRINCRALQAILVAGASLLVVGVVSQIGSDAANALRGVSTDSRRSIAEDRALAGGLQRAGLGRNMNVAYVGNSISTYWAHIARLSIIAEVPVEEQPAFLNASVPTMTALLRSLGEAGAVAIIAPSRPLIAESGWNSVPGTSYYVHFLSAVNTPSANQQAFLDQ